MYICMYVYIYVCIEERDLVRTIKLSCKCKKITSTMESEEEVAKHNMLNPFVFCTKLISLQAEIVSGCIATVASPLFSRQPKGTESQPGLLGKILMGVAAATYVLIVLTGAMAAAATVGVGVVSAWAEEPVCVRESVQFDYTHAHPTAVFPFAGQPSHTIYVSLSLLLPDSDYNRDVGIFQLTAELISVQGNVIAKSSRPSMLRFTSWPIRYTRTLLMGVPLLLGIISETQRLTFPALEHKETPYPQTDYIRITLIPRSGTLALPQFYDAQVVVNSRPPWVKEVVYRWKLTLCVWTTLYVFMIVVLFLVVFMKPLVLPVMVTKKKYDEDYSSEEAAVLREAMLRDDREVVESLQRWQRSRIKRKAALLQDTASASSMALSHEEGTGDSESVCR